MAFGSFRDPPNSVFHQFLLPSQIQFSTSFSIPVFYQFSLPRVLYKKKNWEKTPWQFGGYTKKNSNAVQVRNLCLVNATVTSGRQEGQECQSDATAAFTAFDDTDKIGYYACGYYAAAFCKWLEIQAPSFLVSRRRATRSANQVGIASGRGKARGSP